MNNLQFLFAQQLKQDQGLVSVLNEAITLYQRSNSQYWQCRFKLENGSWYHASTASNQLANLSGFPTFIYLTYLIPIDLIVFDYVQLRLQ